ncbi:hypothetical protein BT69DRAFT_1277077 [Atractiella rhizophila]|nr:hypothetical protein BT69DRAFT_1277077 [Atractiella rhizophila]
MESLKHLLETGGNALKERSSIKILPATLETLVINAGKSEHWNAKGVLRALGCRLRKGEEVGSDGEMERFRSAFRRLRRVRIFGTGWGPEQGRELLEVMTGSSSKEERRQDTPIASAPTEGDIILLPPTNCQRIICHDAHFRPDFTSMGPDFKGNLLDRFPTHFFENVGCEVLDGKEQSKWIYSQKPLSLSGAATWDDVA